jgi:hypothetical protein
VPWYIGAQRDPCIGWTWVQHLRWESLDSLQEFWLYSKTKVHKKVDADTAELERTIAALDAKAAKEKPIAGQEDPKDR